MDNKFEMAEFLGKYPCYKSQQITTTDMWKISNSTEIKVDLYCQKCKAEKTFIYHGYNFMNAMDLWRDKNRRGFTGSVQTNVEIKYFPLQKKLFENIELKCCKCEEKYNISLMIEDCKITKVGQYPSYGELCCAELDRYKSLYKQFNELKYAVNCYSQGMSVGAFVYLRRILENLVEEKYKTLNNKAVKDKFADKLKKVNKTFNIIPAQLDNVKNQIYVILSKGVHEYTNEECSEMFVYVKIIIELILDKMLHDKEINDKISEATKQIGNKLKEKNN